MSPAMETLRRWLEAQQATGKYLEATLDKDVYKELLGIVERDHFVICGNEIYSMSEHGDKVVVMLYGKGGGDVGAWPSAQWLGLTQSLKTVLTLRPKDE